MKSRTAKPRYVLALDQGTTSSRAILFNRRGRPVAVAQKEFPQLFPKPGWVEHDPNRIWSTQASVAAEVMALAGARAREVAAIGITNQRETTVIWDRGSGQPIANAIVWQDRRTAADCDRLRKRNLDEWIRSRTGLVIDAYFSATKLAWLLKHVPGARRKAANGQLVFGTMDSWLVWNLTGGKRHVTDATNASRTMLFNIHTGDWDPELLKLFDVPRSMLPEIVDSSGDCGETELLGGSVPVPITGLAGDQHAALFGQACTRPGMVKNTYGTGCFMLMHTGRKPIRSKNRLVSTVAWRMNGVTDYALEGSIFIAGAVVQWLRDQLGIIQSAGDVEKLARQVADTDGLYLVPAFAGLGAPHWDPHARGILVGITRGTGKAHIARAALEGIAFQVADVLDAMQSDAGVKFKELRVDGGASSNRLLMQLQSDLINGPVIRSRIEETTALGAAFFAGLATGFWADQDELNALWKSAGTFSPEMPVSRRRALRRGWSRALDRARGWETGSR